MVNDCFAGSVTSRVILDTRISLVRDTGPSIHILWPVNDKPGRKNRAGILIPAESDYAVIHSKAK